MKASRWALFLLAVSIEAYVSACGGRASGGAAFSQSAVDQLRLGMKPSEIIARFGPPARVYDMDVGAEVGEVWKGVVYEYDMHSDPAFLHTHRLRRNRLVFALVHGDTLLNNWVLQETPSR